MEKKISNPINDNQKIGSFDNESSSFSSDPFSSNVQALVPGKMKIDLRHQISEHNAYDEESNHSPVSPEMLKHRQESNIKYML